MNFWHFFVMVLLMVNCGYCNWGKVIKTIVKSSEKSMPAYSHYPPIHHVLRKGLESRDSLNASYESMNFYTRQNFENDIEFGDLAPFRKFELEYRDKIKAKNEENKSIANQIYHIEFLPVTSN